MVNPTVTNALRQYKTIDAQSATACASPHRLIQMLMESALESLAKTRGHIQRGDIAGRGEQIGRAISLVGGLREGLNLDSGGALAANLDRLYDYIQNRLLEANLHADSELIDEVIHLLHPVKEAWDAIGKNPNGETSLAAATADMPA